MHTVKLKVSDRVYDKFIWFLSKFSKDEVEIIPETSDFAKIKEYLAGELDEITNGKANFIVMEDAEEKIDSIIKKHEDSI